MTYPEFPKIARLSRDIVITEKLDGTNAQVYVRDISAAVGGTIQQDVPSTNWLWTNGVHAIYAGSRTRWITPDNDNFGFARWVQQNAEELVKLGPGHHYGEWWGVGIQRGYDLHERRFSLFNVRRWRVPSPAPSPTDAWQLEVGAVAPPIVCGVVPLLYRGPMTKEVDHMEDCGPRLLDMVQETLDDLERTGSHAARGYKRPEGIVIYHSAQGYLFKKTIEGDESPKGAK